MIDDLPARDIIHLIDVDPMIRHADYAVIDCPSEYHAARIAAECAVEQRIDILGTALVIEMEIAPNHHQQHSTVDLIVDLEHRERLKIQGFYLANTSFTTCMFSAEEKTAIIKHSDYKAEGVIAEMAQQKKVSGFIHHGSMDVRYILTTPSQVPVFHYFQDFVMPRVREEGARFFIFNGVVYGGLTGSDDFAPPAAKLPPFSTADVSWLMEHDDFPVVSVRGESGGLVGETLIRMDLYEPRLMEPLIP